MTTPASPPSTLAQWRLLRELRGAGFGAVSLEAHSPAAWAVAEALRRRGLAEWTSPDHWTGEWDYTIVLTGAGCVIDYPTLRDAAPDCPCCAGSGKCREVDYSDQATMRLVPGERTCECRWDLEGD